MTMRETLIAARKLIAAGWCQFWYAKTLTGGMTIPNAGNACFFCMAGAVASVRGRSCIGNEDECIRHLKKVCGMDVATYNDRAIEEA